MTFFRTKPLVFHGGDDINHALSHLSWRELAIGFGLVLAIFLLILILVAITN